MRQVWILIAEDYSYLASFIEKGLKKSGFETLVASNGLQALTLMQQEPVDLLVLDLGLPIKNGWEVLQEVRLRNLDLPIIVVTAATDERDRKRVLQMGATDYLPKPFRFSDLLTKIKFYLNI